MTDKILIERALLRQAIDTIGYYASVCGEDDRDTPAKQTQAALRAALDAPVQEPVVNQQMTTVKESLTDQPRKAVKLSDDEIYEMYSEPSSDAEMLAFGRDVEAAVLAKNGVTE